MVRAAARVVWWQNPKRASVPGYPGRSTGPRIVTLSLDDRYFLQLCAAAFTWAVTAVPGYWDGLTGDAYALGVAVVGRVIGPEPEHALPEGIGPIRYTMLTPRAALFTRLSRDGKGLPERLRRWLPAGRQSDVKNPPPGVANV